MDGSMNGWREDTLTPSLCSARTALRPSFSFLEVRMTLSWSGRPPILDWAKVRTISYPIPRLAPFVGGEGGEENDGGDLKDEVMGGMMINTD